MMMKATVGNINNEEIKNILVEKMGYSLEDRISIDLINEVADQIGLPQAEVEGFSKVGFYPQRNEDGSIER
jgi:hypothetical protein